LIVEDLPARSRPFVIPGLLSPGLRFAWIAAPAGMSTGYSSWKKVTTKPRQTIYLQTEALSSVQAHAGSMDITTARTAVATDDIVVTNHLTRAVGRSELRIIDDISFRIPRNSLFSISGPSGSGKTTLLNLMTGIDRPTAGTVIFDGEPLRARSENALARWRGRYVGIIFQFFHLIPTLTAFENVLLALELGGGIPRPAWRDRARACLASVEMETYTHRLPSELSGGQQQRVAIARAIANDPPLIVADEPTGNLDSRTAAAVFGLLEGLTSIGKTVVYVTHDRELAGRAAASVDLLDGRIVARHVTQSGAVWSDG
jgi:putative ABC transport system ATP-binding protein